MRELFDRMRPGQMREHALPELFMGDALPELSKVLAHAVHSRLSMVAAWQQALQGARVISWHGAPRGEVRPIQLAASTAAMRVRVGCLFT